MCVEQTKGPSTEISQGDLKPREEAHSVWVIIYAPPNLRRGGRFMNEMCVSTGFMNRVTSLFVPNLCLDHHNNVAAANGPTHKNIIWIIKLKIIFMNNDLK